MTAYLAYKSLTEEQRDGLLRTGLLSLTNVQKMMIYEYYLAAFEDAGGRWGVKHKAREQAAKHFRVTERTVIRAIDFCEGK